MDDCATKWYVCSGELSVVIIAPTPMKAAIKALDNFGNNKFVDSRYFIIDQCGFRTSPQQCTKDGIIISTKEVLETAGYIDENDNGTGHPG